jgi:hypothetical protein
VLETIEARAERLGRLGPWVLAALLTVCTGAAPDGPSPSEPVLVSTYHPVRTPHEFFLWQDPNDPGRALLYLSTPGYFGGSLLVTDISTAREGVFREVATWSTGFPDPGFNDDLHSLSVSPDGSRAYLAFLTGGFFVLDTSEVAKGLPTPDIRLVTPLTNRVRWPGADRTAR